MTVNTSSRIEQKLLNHMTTDFSTLAIKRVIDILGRVTTIAERYMDMEKITRGEKMIMNKYKQIYGGVYTGKIFPVSMTSPESMEYKLWHISQHSDPLELEEAWGTVIFTIIITIMTGHLEEGLPFLRSYLFKDKYMMPELYIVISKEKVYNPVFTYPIPILFSKKYQNNINKTIPTQERLRLGGYGYQDTLMIYDSIQKSETFIGCTEWTFYQDFCQKIAMIRSTEEDPKKVSKKLRE
jgi:hypothetical protein